METEFFLRLSNALPEAMFMLSGNGTILAVNPGSSTLLGIISQDIVGKNISEFLIDSDEKIVRYLRNWSRSSELVPGALQWRHSDGKTIDCVSEGAAISPQIGQSERYILLRCTKKQANDNRFSMLNKELENLRKEHHKLMDQKGRLEEYVAERTSEIACHAKELERVNMELDQFAYATSHDLKAPLRAIANLSQWIEEDIGSLFTEDTRKQMDLLRRRVHRMEALINGILEYSRIGRVTVDVEDVDVSSLLGEVVESLSLPVNFTVEIDTDMPVLTTSYTRISQVFSNLLSNAIKYNDKSNGNVKISVTDTGQFYEFALADNGPGIEPQYHEKIFMIFQTLQARDSYESTGLGLSLVKKIIEEQGGKIHLTSEPDRGTTFYFTWPKPLRSLGESLAS